MEVRIPAGRGNLTKLEGSLEVCQLQTGVRGAILQSGSLYDLPTMHPRLQQNKPNAITEALRRKCTKGPALT